MRLVFRLLGYFVAVIVVAFVAGSVGMTAYESTECTNDGTDCDLGFLTAIDYALIAVVVTVVAAVVTEVCLAVRRRRLGRAA